MARVCSKDEIIAMSEKLGEDAQEAYFKLSEKNFEDPDLLDELENLRFMAQKLREATQVRMAFIRLTIQSINTLM